MMNGVQEIFASAGINASDHTTVSPRISAQELNLPDWQALRTRDPATNSAEINTIVRNMDILEKMEAGSLAPGHPMKYYAKEIAQAIETLYNNISSLRDATFELVNENSANVYGRLREGKTAKDRDEYVTRLDEYFKISDATGPYTRNCDQSFRHGFYMHHATALYGDRQALREGRGVPDLTYNRGEVQCC
jgi:hypothetical protein